MTQDVRQWLAEIKTLQQKLTEAHQERDEAYASAANWRSLYETEAKQRRTETNLGRKAIDSLKSELQELRDLSQLSRQASAEHEDDLEIIRQRVSLWGTVDELREHLTQALLECDRLANALRAEQINHVQTRKELTTALGDTINLLTKERIAHKQEAENPTAPTGLLNDLATAKSAEARTPSLELPQFD